MTGTRRRVPKIELSRQEKLHYDNLAGDVLRNCLGQYTRLHGIVDTDDWTLVRKHKQMSIFRSLEHSGNPKLSVMAGTGLMAGTLEDVMDGLYCDTSADVRTVTTLLKHKVVDGAVFNVTERRAPEAPFRFAGIKWLAVKAPWGITKNRDLLTYERMGTTVDADGNELAFHVLQSIERPEWPAGCVKGIKREYTSTCYLYRRHSVNRVQCFLWGEVHDLGSVGRRLAEYVVAGSWLKVVNTVACAEAKKCAKLMSRSNERQWPPLNNECTVCKKAPGIWESQRQCAGCKNNVCKSCSAHRPIFQLDRRAGKPLEERFCKLCSTKVASTAGTVSPPRERVPLDPIGRARGNTHGTRHKSSVTTPQATVTSSFQTEDSDDENSTYAQEMAPIRLRSSYGFDQEVTFDRESFPSDPVDMVWMPDPSLNDSRASVMVLLSEKKSDEVQLQDQEQKEEQQPRQCRAPSHHSHRHCSTDSARGVPTRRRSSSSVRGSDDIWSTGGLGQFDLGLSECGSPEDDFLAQSLKHRPTRASDHKQFTRSQRPQDWENFVTDLYVLTPTSTGFFPQY